MVCIVCHFTLFKNWLKYIFILTAYVWEAAPCSTLPTADENADRICCDHSVFRLGVKELWKQRAKGTKSSGGGGLEGCVCVGGRGLRDWVRIRSRWCAAVWTKKSLEDCVLTEMRKQIIEVGLCLETDFSQKVRRSQRWSYNHRCNSPLLWCSRLYREHMSSPGHALWTARDTESLVSLNLRNLQANRHFRINCVKLIEKCDQSTQPRAHYCLVPSFEDWKSQVSSAFSMADFTGSLSLFVHDGNMT